MARKQVQDVKTNVSSDVINAIINSTDLKNYVPVTTPNAESIRKVGNIIIDSPNLRNTFIDTLVNRIATVKVWANLYNNPFAFLKKKLSFGEVIEEVFIELIEAIPYDMEEDAETRNKIRRPSVKSAFHVSNFRQHYDVSISVSDLSRAFMSEDGVTNLVEGIVAKLYTSMEYDEYLCCKYLISSAVCNNLIGVKSVSELNASNAKAVLVDIKELTSKFKAIKTDYNVLGVHNNTPITKQILILSSRAKALLDVEALAVLFHIEKGELEQRIIEIDDFSDFDGNRVKKLLGEDYYYDFSDEELGILQDSFYGVLVDEDWFQIYDHELEVETDRNPVNQVTKYILHKWSTYAISAFANAVAFVNGGRGVINSVTLTADSLSINTDADGKLAGDTTINFGSWISAMSGSKTIFDKAINWVAEVSGTEVSDATLLTHGIVLDHSNGNMKILGGISTDYETLSIVLYPKGNTTTELDTITITFVPPEE